MTPCACGNSDLVKQQAGFFYVGGILFLHTHRAASATDVSGKTKQILCWHEGNAFISGSLGSLAKIQFTANRNAEYMNSGACALCHQGLIYLFGRKSNRICSVHSVKIAFVVFIKRFFIGNLLLLQYANRVCFRCHENHRTYYTTSCQHFQVCIVCGFGYPRK